MTAYVHVGQCGNQLGAAYWRLVGAPDDSTDDDATTNNAAQDAALSSARGSTAPAAVAPPHTRKQLQTKRARAAAADSASLCHRHFYMRPSRRARCVLVDTEPKVVAAALASGACAPAFTHVEQSGRGNNWAMGYNFQRFRRNVAASSRTTMAAIAASASASCCSKRALLPSASLESESHELVELALESLQRVAEATDCFEGTVLMHSLGGGTGAGLGSRLLERIRDLYPRAYLLAVSVAPSWRCGDTPLQNYNAVLTLAHLQEHADCVVYKDNDELLRTAAYWKTLRAQQQQQQDTDARSSSQGSGLASLAPRVSLADLNALAAADLAGLLFPVVAPSSALGTSVATSCSLGSLVHDLCPLPAAKFLDVRTGVLRAKAPATASRGKLRAGDTDPLFHADVRPIALAARRNSSSSNDSDTDLLDAATSLLRHTAQSFPRSPYGALATRTVVRGFGFADASLATTRETLAAATDAAFPGVAWQPSYAASATCSAAPPFSGVRDSHASVTIATNNGHVVASAEQYLERAQRQFRARAYVHWYTQHGLEESDFGDAFEKCARLVSDYKALLQ